MFGEKIVHPELREAQKSVEFQKTIKIKKFIFEREVKKNYCPNFTIILSVTSECI